MKRKDRIIQTIADVCIVGLLAICVFVLTGAFAIFMPEPEQTTELPLSSMVDFERSF